MNYPDYRPRRMRRTEGLRRMIRETRLAPDDFVYPLFEDRHRPFVRAQGGGPGADLEVDKPHALVRLRQLGKELGIVLAETRLGRSLEDALQDAGERMGSPDFDWAILAINIQREVGGNLAELLSTVADTMIARGRLRREVKALTAEGRMTAIILGLLPIVIGMALYVLNPDYMQIMFTRSIGKIVLAGSTLWAVLGFFWMKKIITVDA